VILIIETVSIRTGGGLTHLLGVINNPQFNTDKFEKVYLLTTIDLDDKLNNKGILVKRVSLNFFNKIKFIMRPSFILGLIKEKKEDCLVFAPAGTFFSKHYRYVSMSQNMLVFDKKERSRFPFSFSRLRYNLLEIIQQRSFKNASGNIFLSQYAFEFISRTCPKIKSIRSAIIYHGISDRFIMLPREQKDAGKFSLESPFNILYVSIINYYKHQITVIEAIKKLRRKNIGIHLHLVGPMNPSIESSFQKSLESATDFVTYHGAIPYDKIQEQYKKADLFLFASTCENMPNILIEAMSAGLPILCSSYGPMPEILEDAGLYCDPTNAEDITSQLEKLLNNKELRESLAHKSFNASKQFSWGKCAKETSQFLNKVAFP
jgi:glycosyltransferase involved in cell wall biosynthesis